MRFKCRPRERREEPIVTIAKLCEPTDCKVLTVWLKATAVNVGVIAMYFERMMKRPGIAGVNVKDNRQAIFVS